MTETTSHLSELPGLPTVHDVHRARDAIRDTLRDTPLIASPELSRRAGARVWLKPECLQRTGAFKIRGAANKLASLTAAERERGVVTASSGNHGLAVAQVAARASIRTVICMSTRVPDNKVQRIRGYGAEVVQQGDRYDDAERHAFALAAQQGLTWISAFDDPHVIAGQGTIGLELLAEQPALDTVLVPLSGGGLIAGVALALKATRPAIRVIGVSMDRAPMMALSLQAGKPVEVPEQDTLASALIGSVGADNRYTFRMVQTLVDDVVLVTEDEILAAMGFAKAAHDLTVEGGGAVGIAALLHGHIVVPGQRVVIVLSGGNVDPDTVARAHAAWRTR
ncbi:MAG: threonine/serine dehydratase [bacterium]